MYISDSVKYVGVNDRNIDLFEGQYFVPEGMSYNSYVVFDEKIAVLDTVDGHFCKEWLENLENALNGKEPDYLIVQHMEPDHSACIADFAAKYPKAKIVGNAQTFKMIANFFSVDFGERKEVVTNGQSLSLGKKSLTFVFAPMVHWPEVMVTYLDADKVLFSADGFGKFGALDAKEDWDCEARRYYFGIVGKYGAQVQALLKKAAALDIDTICPLHGPVLKGEEAAHAIKQYDTWSSYKSESDGVVICYASVYGNTKKAAELLYSDLIDSNCKVTMFDLARCDMAEAVEDAFRYSKLVLASITYNADVFPVMREFLSALCERNYQNRTVGFIENGSWAPLAAKIMRSSLEKCKDITFLENTVTVNSAVKENNIEQIHAMARELA